MKALDSRVIVQVIKDDACTKIGSFVIPEGTEDYDKAKVIEIGPKTEGVVKDDYVYVYKNAGKEFKVDGKTYRTLSTSEIIVVL